MNREELLESAKPILFNTEMTQATLDGRKGATRRVIKDIPKNYEFQGIVTSTTGRDSLIGSYMFGMGCSCVYKKPRYQVGDILYVRETWRSTGTIAEPYAYKADEPKLYLVGESGDILTLRYKWRPSIHMPKEAARIFLHVTDVRAERLQDITEEQAIKEGVKAKHDTACSGTSARITFAELWDSTLPPNKNKFKCPENEWRTNPWVWVYEFERMMPE